MTGKNADSATPICALAAAIRRSAAAMSGRRSSRVDGSPAGMTGSAGTLATGAIFLLYACFSFAVTSGWQRICAVLLLGALLPTGMVAFDPDRPEMPAFCLLVAILLLWRRTPSIAARSLLFAGSGIVFLIHPFAGIAGWMLLVFLLLFEERAGRLAGSEAGNLGGL